MENLENRKRRLSTFTSVQYFLYQNNDNKVNNNFEEKERNKNKNKNKNEKALNDFLYN